MNHQTLWMAPIVLVLLLAGAVAQEQAVQERPTVLIGADSPLYGLKRAIENVELKLTGNEVAKAKLYERLAEKRLKEAELLAEKNETNKAIEILEDYGKNIEAAKKLPVPIDLSKNLATKLAEIESRQRELKARIDALRSKLPNATAGSSIAENPTELPNLTVENRTDYLYRWIERLEKRSVELNNALTQLEKAAYGEAISDGRGEPGQGVVIAQAPLAARVGKLQALTKKMEERVERLEKFLEGNDTKLEQRIRWLEERVRRLEAIIFGNNLFENLKEKICEDPTSPACTKLAVIESRMEQ